MKVATVCVTVPVSPVKSNIIICFPKYCPFVGKLVEVHWSLQKLVLFLFADLSVFILNPGFIPLCSTLRLFS